MTFRFFNSLFPFGMMLMMVMVSVLYCTLFRIKTEEKGNQIINAE